MTAEPRRGVGDLPADAVALKGVAKLYGASVALKSINLRVPAGETLLLLGPNGSGKTTLLKIVAGAISPTLGTVSVFGQDISASAWQLRSEVALLSVDTYLYEELTALENLTFILRIAGRRIDRDALLRTLGKVGLASQAGSLARTFSTGMKRRLALARVMLLQPALILLDEPYTALDEPGAELVDRFIRRCHGEGRTTILATHDAKRGLSVADMVLMLEQGKVARRGAPQDFGATDRDHVG